VTTHLKQLGSIIEKFTYMGTCDLFLDPAGVSLRGVMVDHHPTIIGLLLERQLDTLSRSLWKDGVSRVVSTLLLHAKEVYTGDEMPIRRARILLRCMDFLYHVGLDSSSNLGTPPQMGEELAKLLTRVVGAVLASFPYTDP
jgi:separase